MPDGEVGRRGEGNRLACRIYVLFAPIIYLAYALLTPPFQTPDEHQHLFRAWQLSTGSLISERRGDMIGSDLPAGLVLAAKRELHTAEPHGPKARPVTPIGERFSRATPVGAAEPWQFTNFIGSASYSPAGYLPQVISIWLGRAFDWPVEWILRLGRVLNGALTFVLLIWAMRILPVGHLPLMVIALMPMTAACAGSFGQDGLVIGASAALTALCLRAIMVARWPRQDGLEAAILIAVVSLAKFVYLPIAALGLFLRDGSGRWRIAPAPLLAMILAALLILAWLPAGSGLAVRSKSVLPAPGEQLAFMLGHPMIFPTALMDHFGGRGLIQTWDTLFTFGWLNVGPDHYGMACWYSAVLLALVCGDAGAKQLPRLWRLWAWLVCLGIAFIIALSMYLAATPLGSSRIYGVQGRYLIPLMLPMLIALLIRPWHNRPGLFAGAIAVLLLLANGFALHLIVTTYYT